MMAACQHPADLGDLSSEAGGNVVLSFTAEGDTRASCRDCFSKLNVQLFDATGQKVFDKIKTQTSSDDENFGLMSLPLEPGGYTVVAVGHSSAVSATISSPTEVRFTAKDGQKLTDTFCVTSTIDVGEDPEHFDLTLLRATAMFRLVLTDDIVPPEAVKIKFEYSGGSANVNPTTLEGITHSSQTEVRQAVSPPVYEVYTFPYQSTAGTLKVTVSALDAAGNVLRQRTFDKINVARNHITTYTGHFFDDGGGTLTQPSLGFIVESDWSGEDMFDF